MANWSDMPYDIVNHFAESLQHDVEEFVRFSCVCNLWRSCAMYHQTPSTIAPCAPWLMLTKRENDKVIRVDNNEEGVRSFYSLGSKKVFNLNLPYADGRKCWGTPYGWLFTMGVDMNINLLNPLSRVQISLPPQSTFQHQHPRITNPMGLLQMFITKIALTSNPSRMLSPESAHGPVLMAIYGEFKYLAIARPGDKAWTSLKGSCAKNIKDIIFFNGHFYAVNTLGTLRKCEINRSPLTAIDVASPPDDVDPVHTFYLVEMSGDLYFVARVFITEDEDENDDEDGDIEDSGDDDEEEEEEDDDKDEDDDIEDSDEDEDEVEDVYGVRTKLNNQTKHFSVFKFDLHTKNWAKVVDLGDHAFFVGNNTSFSISTSNYPGFKSNCIYFTDDHSDLYQNGFCDMGVYDVSKDTIEAVYSSSDEISMFSRPLFFMPTLL